MTHEKHIPPIRTQYAPPGHAARDATIPGRVEVYRDPIAATPGCACATCCALNEYATSPEGMSDDDR